MFNIFTVGETQVNLPLPSPQCEGEMSCRTEEEEAARHKKNLHLHWLLHPLLFPLCYDKVTSSSVAHGFNVVLLPGKLELEMLFMKMTLKNYITFPVCLMFL